MRKDAIRTGRRVGMSQMLLDDQSNRLTRRQLEMRLDYAETFAPAPWHRPTALATGMLWPLFDKGLLGVIFVSRTVTPEEWPDFVRNPLTWRVRRADEVHAS